jgi:hypothetical protein
MLERWNATVRDYPRRNISELFEAGARRLRRRNRSGAETGQERANPGEMRCLGKILVLDNRAAVCSHAPTLAWL